MSKDKRSSHGECQVCFRHAKLVKSHIIPKSISRILTGRSGPSLVVPSSPSERPRRIQDGLYARFCCADCERLFGPIDEAFGRFYRQIAHGVPIVSGASKPVARVHEDVSPLTITGFFASLLLRGCLSGHEFFARVRLGHSARRRVVRALNRGMLTHDTGFHVILARVTGELGPLITDPHEHEVRGHRGFAVRLPNLVALVFPDRSALNWPLPAIEVGGPNGVVVMEREEALPGEEAFVVGAAAQHYEHIEGMLGRNTGRNGNHE